MNTKTRPRTIQKERVTAAREEHSHLPHPCQTLQIATRDHVGQPPYQRLNDHNTRQHFCNDLLRCTLTNPPNDAHTLGPDVRKG